MKRAVLLVGYVLLMPIAFAEELPPLGEAISGALAHSPEVAMAEARVLHAEAQLRSSRWGWFHPEMRVFAGNSAIEGAARAGVQVSHDVMRLLTLNHDEVSQADHELTLARQGLVAAKERVVRQVAEARMQLEQSENLVALKAQGAAQRQELLALTQTEFDAGTVSLDQLLAARYALAEALQELLQAQGERHLAQLTWDQLLGESPP